MLDDLLNMNHRISTLCDKWFSDTYDPDEEEEEDRLAEEAEYNDLNAQYTVLRKKIIDALKGQKNNTQ